MESLDKLIKCEWPQTKNICKSYQEPPNLKSRNKPKIFSGKDLHGGEIFKIPKLHAQPIFLSLEKQGYLATVIMRSVNTYQLFSQYHKF